MIDDVCTHWRLGPNQLIEDVTPNSGHEVLLDLDVNGPFYKWMLRPHLFPINQPELSDVSQQK